MIRDSVYILKKFIWAIAAAACLILASTSSQAQDDPPPQAGRLSIVNGAVSIQAAGTSDWGQAYLNYPVGPGDRIFTDSDGRAEIQVGRTYVRVGPNSDVTFVDLDEHAVTFGIAQGALHIRTRGLWDSQSFYVQTPSGSTTVNGPADFRVDVYPDQQTAIFTNYDGDVYVSGANDFGMDTGPGQALELVGTNPVYPQWLQPANGDDLDRWSERRDQQIAQTNSFRYVSQELPGAEDLDNYGQWTPGTDYGDMWFPNVSPGWSPYHNGHWVNHAPWGWVWVEDEPWGYAPFHYGRWVTYRGRWGWIPGPRAEHPVWSPALVVFAGGIQIGGGGVSVWFPLGPGEPYRPWYPCSPRYVDRVNITNIQESRVVHVQKTYVNVVNVTNVTNVTNVNNITYVNRTVGATAMRQQDFAGGRPAAQSNVRVDPQQMAHVQVLARPEAVPTHEATVNRPPARPVPVAVARPVLINARGLAVAAQPKAMPAPPPVKAAPAPPSLPNRTVVAPPPNVKMTPTARQALQAAPAPRPVQQPVPPHPGQPQVPARPPVTPPAPAAERPAPVVPNQPRPAPVPAPVARPPAQPEPQTPPRPVATPQPTTPPRPAERPAPPPQPTPPVRTQGRPAPEPTPPPRPAERPAPPPQPAPPVRTQERPAPQPTPPPRPAERPTPQPPPQPRPEVRPEAPPPTRPAPPPPPQPRPNVEPAPRQAPPHQPPPPPADKNKKPDKKDEPKPKPE